jgi:hypothetical protein
MRSGLLENSFMDLMRINPYISGKTVVEFPRENIITGARFWYHPLEKIIIHDGRVFGFYW